jgi:hypothetical protein
MVCKVGPNFYEQAGKIENFCLWKGESLWNISIRYGNLEKMIVGNCDSKIFCQKTNPF